MLIIHSIAGDTLAYHLFASSSDFSVSHGGRNDVTTHARGKHHKAAQGFWLKLFWLLETNFSQLNFEESSQVANEHLGIGCQTWVNVAFFEQDNDPKPFICNRYKVLPGKS